MSTPTLEAFKDFLSMDAADTQDDPALRESLDAALAAQAVVCAYPLDDFGDALVTSDLELAVYLRAQRYMARRNSPEGVVGLSGSGGDLVAARVPSFDNDVLYLEGPHRKVVVA
jgi:hypothetical protein